MVNHLGEPDVLELNESSAVDRDCDDCCRAGRPFAEGRDTGRGRDGDFEGDCE